MNGTNVNALKNSKLFSGLSNVQIKDILRDIPFEIIEYQKSDIICSPENFEKRIGIILTGKLQVSRFDKTRKFTMNVLKKSDCFGMAVLFNDNNRFDATITAKTKCKVLYLTEGELSKIFAKNSLVAQNYIGIMSERIAFLSKRLSILSHPSPNDRIEVYLSEIEADENGIVQIDTSLSALCVDLNIARATLYRYLSDENSDYTLIENGKIRRKE